MEGSVRFYCNTCKKYFSEPVVTNRDSETGCYDVLCPICGSDSIDESNRCTCGNPTTQDFCEECYGKVKVALDKLKEELNFDQDKLEDIIANHFGW